jgi:phosphoribosylglycinamide formyltransferase-1
MENSNNHKISHNSYHKRWAVLISGRGSNLAALLDARVESGLDIAFVISSKADAYGLLRAKRSGVPSILTPFHAASNKINWDAIDSSLRLRGITHLFLAGFMKVIPASFVEKWQGRILNLHPSLLPAYPGLNSIERAYVDKADIGLTLHEVIVEVDAGEVIAQRCCLKFDELQNYSLNEVEFLVHINEQRAIKGAICRWNNLPML